MEWRERVSHLSSKELAVMDEVKVLRDSERDSGRLLSLRASSRASARDCDRRGGGRGGGFLIGGGSLDEMRKQHQTSLQQRVLL